MLQRITAILTAILLIALPGIGFAAAEGYYLRGDADADGEVSVLDAVVVRRRLAQMEVAVIDERAADVDGNGLSVIDATLIQKALAYLPDPYHVGEKIVIPAPTAAPKPTGGSSEDLPPMPGG